MLTLVRVARRPAVEIWANRGDVVIPQQCICCGRADGLSDRTYRASKAVDDLHSMTFSLDLPVCDLCRRHSPRLDLYTGCGAVALFLALAGGGTLVAWRTANLELGLVAWLAALLAGFLAYLVFNVVGARDFIADHLVGPGPHCDSCAALRDPCRMTLEAEGFLYNLRFYARLRFASPEYAEAFERANREILRR